MHRLTIHYTVALCLGVVSHSDVLSTGPQVALSETLSHPTHDIRIEITDGPTPWTERGFKNDPNNFQFAVISDNTGGMRPGIIEAAVEKLNLLQPEFVMSVGDLIEGYTEDLNRLVYEWDHLPPRECGPPVQRSVWMAHLVSPADTRKGAIWCTRHARRSIRKKKRRNEPSRLARSPPHD